MPEEVPRLPNLSVARVASVGLNDPLIPVEVRVMLRLPPELLRAFFYVLVRHATLHRKVEDWVT